MGTNELTDFLLARIGEEEASVRANAVDLDAEWPTATAADLMSWIDRFNRRVLAECAAKRRIIELHKSWPVLVDRPPTFESIDAGDPTQLAMRASRQLAWVTEQEYRERFGDEPPTGPIIAALAAVYADHPDYLEEWRP